VFTTTAVSQDTLGLKPSTHFLSSSSTAGSGGHTSELASFKNLIGSVFGSLSTDLLNILNSVWGVGHNQNGKSGATVDLTSDSTKHGVGQVDHNEAAKTVKSILKPHDQG